MNVTTLVERLCDRCGDVHEAWMWQLWSWCDACIVEWFNAIYREVMP